MRGKACIQDDDSYYFEDAIFLVENTRFKVPRHLFEQESPKFRKMFSHSLDQSTREDPLFLKGVSKPDFVAFLKLICPKNLSQRELSSEDWASVLKLSTLWGFDEARAQAIEKLAPTTAAADPIQIILLAKEHDVPQWYSSSLKQLVERPDPLTVEEVNRLGLELGLKIAQMRGKVEGFKIAESRFNQAVHSMTTAFTYKDFWDTVVTDADDWLQGTVSRPPTPRAPGVIRFPPLSPTPSILSEKQSCPHSPRLTQGLHTPRPHSPHPPFSTPMPISRTPSPLRSPPCFPIASPQPNYAKPGSEYDFVSTPCRSKSPSTPNPCSPPALQPSSVDWACEPNESQEPPSGYTTSPWGISKNTKKKGKKGRH